MDLEPFVNLDLEIGLSCQDVVRDPYTTVVKVCEKASTRNSSQPDSSCPPFSPGEFVESSALRTCTHT